MTENQKFRLFHDQPLTLEQRNRIAESSTDQRKQMVDDLHVAYGGFNDALKFVESRHFPVPGAAHDVGKFHMLLGPYRSGKSWPLMHYEQKVNAEHGTREKTPIVRVECADGWRVKQVMIAIVASLTGAQPSERHGAALLTTLACNMIEKFGVELLIVDEIGEVLSKPKGQAGALMSSLRQILDRRVCNIIGVGHSDLHDLVLTSYSYVGGRGGLLNHLVSPPNWHTKTGSEDYILFLNAVDDRLPFRKKSGLGVAHYPAHFYDLSKGSIGYTMAYVAAAAFMALREGTDKIEHRHLVAMGVEARGPNDRFTHFVNTLEPKLVGKREQPK